MKEQMKDRLRILAVEDDPTVAELYQILLAGVGHKVLIARDGAEAVRLMREHPDVVILDLRLPDIDGYTLLKRIRAQPDLRDTPVIIISATVPHGHRGIPGADAVLSKPFDIDELVATVERSSEMRVLH
jgi:CheY-like chemotaxis protein